MVLAVVCGMHARRAHVYEGILHICRVPCGAVLVCVRKRFDDPRAVATVTTLALCVCSRFGGANYSHTLKNSVCAHCTEYAQPLAAEPLAECVVCADGWTTCVCILV